MDGARKVSLVGEVSHHSHLKQALLFFFHQEFYWGFDWIQKDNKLRMK